MSHPMIRAGGRPNLLLGHHVSDISHTGSPQKCAQYQAPQHHRSEGREHRLPRLVPRRLPEFSVPLSDLLPVPHRTLESASRRSVMFKAGQGVLYSVRAWRRLP